MTAQRKCFEDYIKLFSRKSRQDQRAKISFKSELESDGSLKIPSRIWLAFLTPPDLTGARLHSKFKNIFRLKKEMLQTFAKPKLFLHTRDPLHKSSDSVTLAILEILYDLKEQRVLLTEEVYREWIEIANRFGLWKLRYALEDAVFKLFNPENFSLFESVVSKQMAIDRKLIRSIHGILRGALERSGLTKFSILNRGKNIYGVYKKMALRRRSVNEIYDIHGFRILTEAEEECYRAIDVLHRLWPHFPEYYKDYILDPKQNGYQSLHTVLSCLEKRPIEFQVRTCEMERVASSGPANHAEYKKAQGTISFKKLS